MRPGRQRARYAPRVIRNASALRYAAVLAALVAGCGATTPPARTVARSEPLPVSENQQGHHVAAGVDDPSAETSDEPVPADQPSIAGVYLWCQTPRGRACRLASAALGTGPKDPSGLPPSLLTVEDRSDDCTEPTIQAVGGRLAAAFAIQTTGWRDQGGSYLDMSMLSDMYSAAGCINDADPTLPVAKISAADGASPRVYLVRVWDGQTSTPIY
jgi:hypothetical protein